MNKVNKCFLNLNTAESDISELKSIAKKELGSSKKIIEAVQFKIDQLLDDRAKLSRDVKKQGGILPDYKREENENDKTKPIQPNKTTGTKPDGVVDDDSESKSKEVQPGNEEGKVSESKKQDKQVQVSSDSKTPDTQANKAADEQKEITEPVGEARDNSKNVGSKSSEVQTGNKEARPKLSRSQLTKETYDKRIDELFSGSKPNNQGVSVLDDSDVLGLLGFGREKMVLAESKVLKSQEVHKMTPELWKKVPEWLENPLAVFESDTVDGRLVFIAPDKLNNDPILMIVEPNIQEGRASVNLLVNAYDAELGRLPVRRWVKQDKLLYIDNKKSREVSAASWLQLPTREQQNKPGSKVKILSEKNLVKFRDLIGRKKSTGTKTTGSTKQQIIDLLPRRVKRMVGNGVEVVQSVGDLPKDVYSFTTQDGIEGFYDKGNVYLVADKLSKSNLSSTLNHELLHKALAESPKLRKQVESTKAGLKEVFEQVESGEYKGRYKALYDAAMKRMEDADTPDADKFEEFIAYAVSEFNKKPQTIPRKLKQLIEKLISSVKMALMKYGVTVNKLTPADLNALALQAAGIKSGSTVSSGEIAKASKSGYKGNDAKEAIEWNEAVNAELDMSKEARMKRAKDMGFDVDNVLTHSSHEEIINKIKDEGRFGGVIFSTERGIDSNYGEYAHEYFVKGDIAEDDDLTYFANNQYEKFRELVGITDATENIEDDYIKFVAEENQSILYDNDALEKFLGFDAYDADLMIYQQSMRARIAKLAGFNAVRTDDEFSGDTVILINGNGIRSINAAFNPAYKDSGNLLASKSPKFSKGSDAVNDSIDKINRWFNGEPLSSSNNGSLGLAEESRVEKAARIFQDGFNRVKTLQKTIESKGGEVTEESNVYLAEERSSGITAAKLDDLRDNNVKPLVKAMQDKGITLKQLDSFVMATHAEERNKYIAEINPEMPDGGSGITNKDAKNILSDFDKQGLAAKLQSLANRVYEINEQALGTMVSGGLMTGETAKTLRDQYDHYVPLKGKEGVDNRAGTGQGYSVSGTGLKKAMGRGEGNLSESPVAHSIAQAESAIIRSEKAKIGQSLIKLMKDNPDPNFWSVTSSNYNKFISLSGEEFEGFDSLPENMREGTDYERVMAVTADEIRLAQQEGRKPKAKVTYRISPAYQYRDDVFSVMAEGKVHQITIKDQILAEQLKKLNSNELNHVIKGMGAVNRYLAMINTALNPEFVITNLERDLQTAGINLAGEHSAKMAKQVMKDVPKAVKGIWLSVFNKEGAKDNEWSKLYQELKHEGGTIGFFGLEDIETKVAKIEKELEYDDSYLGKTKEGLARLQEVILDANQSVENASRLAAYKAGRDKGMSKNQAASLAKNLTVNFNRRGELAPVLNAAYLFANASIQGTARILTALKYPRVRKIVAGVATTSFALAAYNMAAGGDDDDGVSHWEKLSDHIKQTNLIIMHPDGSGDYFKIKLPYGYNVFWYAGVALHDLIRGENTTVMGTAANLSTTITNAFNPIQGADILDTITPTILKPIEQDTRNINFMNTPIRPENPFDRYDRPESDKAFLSTNKTLKELAKLLNDVTGGNDTKAGYVDISPETMKHYLGWLTGGAGMTAYRGAGTVGKVFSGETIRAKEVPFLRTLRGSTGTYYDTERFYTAIKDIEATNVQVKKYRENKDSRLVEYQKDNRQALRLTRSITAHKKRIKLIRRRKNSALRQGNYKLADKYKQDIAKEMRRFLRRYDAATK